MPLPKTPSGPSRPAQQALFLPAAARQAFAALFDIDRLTITVTMPLVEAPHPMLAAGAAEVQRRRKRWRDEIARYALPDGAQVRVALVGSTWRQLSPAWSSVPEAA